MVTLTTAKLWGLRWFYSYKNMGIARIYTAGTGDQEELIGQLNGEG
jgi:hypothetical protein